MGYLSLKREGFISEEKETKTGNILMICIWLPSLNIIFLFSMFWQCHGPCRILVPQAGIELVLPPLGAWNLNHWTARESPHVAPILTILSLRLPKPHPQKAWILQLLSSLKVECNLKTSSFHWTLYDFAASCCGFCGFFFFSFKIKLSEMTKPQLLNGGH